MKGSYLLLLELDEPRRICIGKMGVLYFAEGFYTYVGSALNGIEPRIKRHFSQNKKHHWHIDYLLDHADICEVVLVPGEQRLECALAKTLAQKLSCTRHFGSCDCRCPGHLFYATERNELNTKIVEALAKLSLTYYRHPVPVPKSIPPFPVNPNQQ